MFILSLVSGSWHLIEDMGPPVQLLLQRSKYFHGNKNLHLFSKAWDDRGKYRIRTPTFFFIQHMLTHWHLNINTWQFYSQKKMIPMNEWYYSCKKKLFITQTSILRNSKKIKYKNLYLIQITITYWKTQFAHFIYNTTILWHSKINRKTIQLA